MPKFPRVGKGFNRLTKSDGLGDTTIQLITSTLLSAGLLAAEAPGTVSKSPYDLQQSITGKAINLTPSQPIGSDQIAFHQSHSSHYSHRSHSSHYSSR